MEEEIVSIIIPVYKVEKYLDKCVQSVVEQTYKNLEIILVNDGSPDKCPEICKEWAKKDKRIKVINKENGGLSSARNAGIDICKGKYEMFIDSDDAVDKNIVKVLFDMIKKYNCDFSMCRPKLVGEDYKIINLDVSNPSVTVVEGEQVITQLFSSPFNYYMTAWAKLYKSSVFKNIRYPEQKLHEDEFVIHYILGNTKSFAYTDLPMYYYLQRQTSIVGQKNLKNKMHIYEAFKDRFNYLSTNYPQFKDKIQSTYLHQIKDLYLSIDNKDKDFNKKLMCEYKTIFSSCKNNSFKDKLFKVFPRLYRGLKNLNHK